jgi:hypothetical protein
MTYDELRLQQLLGPFNRPQGIATLNPLAFQYQDQFYPDLQSTDIGYSIAPPGSADEGYAIGPSGTADDLISTGFYGSPDVGFPFAPANRLGGLDLPRFEGVSQLGRQDEDEEQVEYLPGQEPQGIEKLFKSIDDIYGKLPTPMNFIRSIGENFGKGPTYSRFSPGGTFRGGIYNIGGVNTPIQLANDFYDRTTGLNRFDRARNRFNQTRSLKDLFGASRTLAEFNNARKIAAAQKASGYTSNFMDRPASERNYTGPSGGDNTGGDRGARGAADSFSNRSGMGRTGY